MRAALALAALGCAVAAGLALPAVPATRAASAPRALTATVFPEPAAGPTSAEPLAATSTRAVSSPGTGAWYWPIGTEDFKGWDGWLAPRGAYVHVAQDMPARVGRPVYAIGDGVVWISRADTGGYGPGGTPGGCMIIVHTTAAGQKFRALYGHISRLRYKAGERVSAGAVIATVNGCAHLHFGIHPSAVYRGGNPYAGHVPKTWTDHGGWVNPVKYLRNHPRIVAYSPPKLTRIEIATSGEPVGTVGASHGFAYWNEQGASGLVTWRYDLASGARSVVAPGDPVPEFQETRYSIAPLPAPATGFTVADRKPVLGIDPAHDTPRWGATVRLTAHLVSASGKPFVGARVKLELLAAERWVTVQRGLTEDDGSVALPFKPSTRTVLRARFLPPRTQPRDAAYLGTSSLTVTLTPHVMLTTPQAPATVAAGGTATVTGYLTPRTAAGVVRFEFQRFEGDAWAAAKTSKAIVSRDGTGAARLSRVVRFPLAGPWRVRAWRPPGGAFAESFGDWRRFAVE